MLASSAWRMMEAINLGNNDYDNYDDVNDDDDNYDDDQPWEQNDEDDQH